MASLEVKGRQVPGIDKVLSKEALAFVADLQRKFGPTRKKLLAARGKRGTDFKFLPETESVRKGDWTVAPTPADLQKRHVEITGPVERKMMINALNSGADVFMAEFEDALSPTWENIIVGHVNLMDAVRRTLEFTSPEGKQYRLKDKIATLLVRPRGWHFPEKNIFLTASSCLGP
ncbi:MAG TPA: malate synthase A, partial [Myxococcales bacterium]